MWVSATLRRRSWGAGLTLMASVVIACGEGDDVPSGPQPPEQPPDAGVTPSAGCSDGVLQHGALYRVCFPASWNGDLVLFAHGYVAPQEELAIPENTVGNQSAADLITGLGYAYATTSYRANGLIAPEAVEDLLELVDTVEHRFRPDPARTVIVGFSEGGLVATLGLERHPSRFDGALAGCGPIGDFRAQLDYIGDFRVVFDYFFPNLIPGNALEIPQSVRDTWNEIFTPAIIMALATQPDAARQLIAVTGAATAGDDLPSIAEPTLGLLWYNVFGTEDAQERLGGRPYDNSGRVYAGSSDDAELNAKVDRFTADPAALTGLGRFATTGSPTLPLINLHTTGDPIVPFSQAERYSAKVQQAGATASYTQVDVPRYGHCAFQPAELLAAFNQLWQQIESRVTSTSVVSMTSR
jgi:pimeloyl-ACP methyl ester carboxylesterase